MELPAWMVTDLLSGSCGVLTFSAGWQPPLSGTERWGSACGAVVLPGRACEGKCPKDGGSLRATRPSWCTKLIQVALCAWIVRDYTFCPTVLPESAS